jgi:4-amino-4-deoxy-L-arabinose transferase-like glycosyltransferase
MLRDNPRHPPTAWPVFAFALLAVLTASGLIRPLQPIDETRYAAVAWEMWARGDLLLPVLNGEPYPHKPPLLFWLIHAGWALFGVNEWWLRLLSPLFAAGTLALMASMAARLWPQWRDIAPAAGCVLVASGLYAYFATALMFDTLLGFFCTLGWLGLVRAWRDEHAARGLVLLGCGIAGGLLCKGPAALLHLLPVALAAPLWMREKPLHLRLWWHWYGGIALSTAVATVPVLAWAIPAARAGGAAYGDAIFWGQTAGRMVDSFAHRAPAWLYIAILPLMLVPWLAWPRWWRRLGPAWRVEVAVRFLIAGALLPLLGFSMVSGKRAHYLLPEFVLFALLVARGLIRSDSTRWSLALPAGSLLAAGAALSIAAPRAADALGAPQVAQGLLPGSLVVMVCGMAMLPWRAASAGGEVRTVATATVVAMAALSAGSSLAFRDSHDLQATANRLAELERAGRPAAFVGRYHGQWTFAGRLQRPLTELQPRELAAWLEANPTGRALTVTRNPGEWPRDTQLVDLRRYRGAWLAELAKDEPPLSALKPAAPPAISMQQPEPVSW